MFIISVFVNIKISLSTVSCHLSSKTCLILFREQNAFRKNPLHLLTFHQLQLTFSIKDFRINSFWYEFWFFFHGFLLHSSHDAAKTIHLKAGLFFEKLPFPPWRTSVSQRIEMTINSLLWLKDSWKLLWWFIIWQRI